MAKSKLLKVVCQGCGVTFKVRPSKVRKGEGKYCSLSCSGRAGIKKRCVVLSVGTDLRTVAVKDR